MSCYIVRNVQSFATFKPVLQYTQNENIIKKILKHLNLWLPDNKSPPKNFGQNFSSKTYENHNDYDCGSQIEHEDNYSQINPFEEDF